MIGPLLSRFGRPAGARRWFRDLVAARPGQPPLVVRRLLGARANRQVFEVDRGGTRAVLKRFLDADAADRVGRLAEELALMSAAMAEGPFRLVRCLEADPARGYAILTFAPGERLDRAAAAAGPDARARLVAGAAGWLGAYAAPRHRIGAFGPAFWRDRAAALDLGRADPADHARITALAARLAHMTPALAGRPVLQAATHGDFTPANLTVDGATIWGFDTERETWQAVAREAAQFLIWLGLLAPAPGETLHGMNRSDARAFLQAGLLPPDEAEAVVPFFLAERLGVLLADGGRHRAARMAQLRAMADVLLASPPA